MTVSNISAFAQPYETDDRPREACGVFGIFAPGEDVARATYFGLYSLQHRGQESAGIAVGDGKAIRVLREMGLVSQVFSEAQLEDLHGIVAIGHCRYSTTGSSQLCNAQPMVIVDDTGAPQEGEPFTLAHNGNLVNVAELQESLEASGAKFMSTSDSEVIIQLIKRTSGRSWHERIARALPRLSGAFSLVLASANELFAARDPWGIRPLCLGRIGERWVVASESCALDTVGATLEREIAPGELIRINEDGITSLMYAEPVPKLCSFEFIYFARPDSVIDGLSVHSVRVALGRQLATEHPADADMVMPVPDSAIPMAVGYARQSGIPYGDGLVKNRYIGRTFISPTQFQRDRGIQLKFNPLTAELEGKRLVVIEDSLVRGTTSRPLVALLRKAGAREVHLRIASPPYRHPCHLGMDTGRRSELIAAQHTLDEILQFTGADSLKFLSLEGLATAIGRPAGTSCRACLDGKYPMPVQEELQELSVD
ncbi:MAG: amidophosphoribosyltransferase [Chloroflexi bacterium]|nr:amidophosphoribosyltransferase [Chloroflexota bacterium]